MKTLLFILLLITNSSFAQSVTLEEFIDLTSKNKGEIFSIMNKKGFRIFLNMSDTVASKILPGHLEITTVITFVNDEKYKLNEFYYDNTFGFKFFKTCKNHTFLDEKESLLRVYYATYGNELQYKELTERLWRKDFVSQGSNDLDNIFDKKIIHDDYIDYLTIRIPLTKGSISPQEKSVILTRAKINK